MKRTKIVCTIGPASEKPEILEELIKSGMNVMRLNFSHGDYEEHLGKINTLKKLNKKLDTNVAFMLDTKGPEIRTTDFADDAKHTFNEGDKVTLTTRDIKGDNDTLGITYKGLPNDVEVGGHILIDDGLMDLVIDSIEETEIHCTVQNGATIKGRRGVNVPGAKLKLEAMTEKDKSDLKFGVENDCEFIAASFIRKAQDVIDMRNYLDSIGGNRVKIVSKIENQEGLDNFKEILKVSDGIMVARGDLGVEIPEELVPSAQKMMIKETTAAGKFVITATQMLESMQHNPRATRAEVSDVANAVYDGTSATMLSGESAQGDYPREAVKTMAKIDEASEKDICYWNRFKNKNLVKLTHFDKIEASEDDFEFKKQANFAVCCSAMFANADAIIAVSKDGVIPSLLSSFRPACPIYAITSDSKTYKQMAIENNVTAIYVENTTEYEELLEKGIEILKSKGLLKENDTVVLSGGLSKEDNQTKKFLSNQSTGTIIKI